MNKFGLQLVFSMPVRVVSEANQREHWTKKYKRKKAQQKETHVAWVEATGGCPRPICLPCIVRLVRIGPKHLDTDNLAGSFKHVQDAIAHAIETDDGDERIKWVYAQEVIGKRQYAVRVEVYYGR